MENGWGGGEGLFFLVATKKEEVIGGKQWDLVGVGEKKAEDWAKPSVKLHWVSLWLTSHWFNVLFDKAKLPEAFKALLCICSSNLDWTCFFISPSWDDTQPRNLWIASFTSRRCPCPLPAWCSAIPEVENNSHIHLWWKAMGIGVFSCSTNYSLKPKDPCFTNAVVQYSEDKCSVVFEGFLLSLLSAFCSILLKHSSLLGLRSNILLKLFEI